MVLEYLGVRWLRERRGMVSKLVEGNRRRKEGEG